MVDEESGCTQSRRKEDCMKRVLAGVGVENESKG